MQDTSVTPKEKSLNKSLSSSRESKIGKGTKYALKRMQKTTANTNGENTLSSITLDDESPNKSWVKKSKRIKASPEEENKTNDLANILDFLNDSKESVDNR